MSYSKALTKKPTQSRTKLQKRWYVDASIPKSMPFIGGTSFKAGSGSLNKRSLQQVVNAVRSQVLESKSTYNVTSTTGLLHNTIYTNNLLGQIPIGSGDDSRIGDQIHVRSLRCRLHFIRPTTPQANTYVRCMIIKSQAEYRVSNTDLGSGLGSNEIFQTGANLLHMSIPDFSRCTVLADKLMTIPAGNLVASVSGVCVLDYTIPFTQTFKTTASGYGKEMNYYLVVIPFADGGVTGTTDCGNAFPELLVSFTDGK